MYLLLPEIFICLYTKLLPNALFPTWMITFSISYRVGLLVKDSVSFVLSGNVSISSFLKQSFAWYKIFTWKCFLFVCLFCSVLFCLNILNIILLPYGFHSLCWETSYKSYWWSIIYNMFLLSCYFQYFLFVLRFQKFDYNAFQ